MKKMITTLLLASMLLSLAACGGAEKDKETETGTDTADTTAQGESETETEKADPLAGLDVIDMEGYTFRQLMMQAGMDSIADAGFHCNVCIVEDGASLLIYVLYAG